MLDIIETKQPEVISGASTEFASPPEPPTEGQLKLLRKQYVTVQHPRVVGCGHALDMTRKPRTNCETCVFAWFNSHGEVCQQLDKMHTEGNDELIVQLQGIKFYSQWRKFMSTVANWEQESNEQVD